MPFNLPPNLVVAAGTYDGVLAGWELKENKLKLTFATAVHGGSIRSLSMASSPEGDAPGSLLSCGYDETLRTHDWHKRLTCSGEVRTPADFGTPVCSAYAPPVANSTHCIVGFSNGKVAIYKKRDWSVQHVLAGHDGGVGSLSVHPSGKLALSGGMTDGKLKLWDLTKGRLTFVNKITPASSHNGRTRYDPILSLVWSKDGNFYGLAHGSHITVREVASGKDLLDVDLPSRVNQIALMSGPEGLFIVAACNDGSLPVLAVEDSDDENRRAIMAIEPVDSLVAGEERFKCITCVHGYYVVTANSAGVVSLMDLAGAVRMITEEGEGSVPTGNPASSDEDDDDEELAVDIIESIQLGTGARITCLAAWAGEEGAEDVEPESEEEASEDAEPESESVVIDTSKEKVDKPDTEKHDNNLKRKHGPDVTPMNAAAVEKARALVTKATKLKKRKERKKRKTGPGE
jgi:protein MAK11